MAGVEKETREQKLARGLTATDIDLQEVSEMAGNLDNSMGVGLAEAIARSELIAAKKEDLVRVQEGIFIRDILPAICGELGSVDMRWWVNRFGSAYRGFIIIDAQGKDIIEFPPMAPSPSMDNSKDLRGVGDSMANYRNRVRHTGAKAGNELKDDLRKGMVTGGIFNYIMNISTVERICRRYGKTIMTGAKPHLVEIINQSVEGLDEALGPLGQYGQTASPTPQGLIEQKGNAYDDDDEQTLPGTFD